jgi:nifR3 family TIM-barrel protein
VVLAPMAGITNAAYRRLCSEQGALRDASSLGSSGANGLYVCEMITSRGLVEGDPTTRQMLVFDEQESVRSVQLYGTDPAYVGRATEILCTEYGVAHVDLNFGCPVPKVTRKGGGAALPWKRTLLGEILTAAVTAASRHDVPVTMKTRKGIDEDHLTYLDAGRIAEASGVAAIALHGRTAIQGYSGVATSGRPPTRCGWSSRPAPTASSWAAAASDDPGCSATWRTRSRLRWLRSERSERWFLRSERLEGLETTHPASRASARWPG